MVSENDTREKERNENDRLLFTYLHTIIIILARVFFFDDCRTTVGCNDTRKKAVHRARVFFSFFFSVVV